MSWPTDWKIKNCLLLCGALTLAQLLLTAVAAAGPGIPVLRQAVGFVFLTFVPGILILRTLKIHDINPVESIAYSVGFSLALAMFSGLTINFLLPPLNVKQPISQLPILLALVVEIALLSSAAWYRDRDYRNKLSQPQPLPGINSVLFLLAMLCIIIAGVKISDLTGNNWALIAGLLAIALTVTLASFNRFITPAMFPLTLFVISLSLLYQTSLMSPYLIGSDIYAEYSFFQDTVAAGAWNYAIPSAVNSCLSIVMLAPSYSFMLGLDGISVFKALYPILFSFMPIIMFRFLRIQIGPLPAFLAVFFFMAVPTFSLEMVSLCRQQIAELFFCLFILLLVDRKIGALSRMLMMVLFAISIVVSHYSLSFITLIYLALLIPTILLLKSRFFIKFWSFITSWSGGLPGLYRQPGAGVLPLALLIVPVVTYYVFGMAWYLLIGQGSNFVILSMLWSSQAASLASSAAAAQDLLVQAAIGADFFKVSWEGQVFRVLQYITQWFIIVGCLRLLFMPRNLKLRIEYVAMSILSAALLAACIRLPSFAIAFNTTRWYHVLLITLAPFFVIGGQTLLQIMTYAWSRARKHPIEVLNERPAHLAIVSLAIMVPYFIVTSGIVYEVSGMQDTTKIEAPFSIALSSHRLDLMGNFSVRDDYGARWAATASAARSNIYSDIHTWKILLQNRFPGAIQSLTPAARPENGDLLFLTAWNTSHNSLTFSIGYPGLRTHIDLTGFVNGTGSTPWKERIYANGSTEIFEALR